MLALAWVALAAVAPSSGLGAAYPGTHPAAVASTHTCYADYRFATDATIAQVADFYIAQGRNAGVPLTDDTRAKFADYRTLLFVAQPKMLFVILERKDGHTSARISVKTRFGADCR